MNNNELSAVQPRNDVARAEAQAHQWVVRYGKDEAERRAYVASGSDAWRFALMAAVRKEQ